MDSVPRWVHEPRQCSKHCPGRRACRRRRPACLRPPLDPSEPQCPTRGSTGCVDGRGRVAQSGRPLCEAALFGQARSHCGCPTVGLAGGCSVAVVMTTGLIDLIGNGRPGRARGRPPIRRAFGTSYTLGATFQTVPSGQPHRTTITTPPTATTHRFIGSTPVCGATALMPALEPSTLAAGATQAQGSSTA